MGWEWSPVCRQVEVVGTSREWLVIVMWEEAEDWEVGLRMGLGTGMFCRFCIWVGLNSTCFSIVDMMLGV